MRVLAVVYCYPPLLVPAAICYMKILMGLARSGVEVEILRMDPDTFESPTGFVQLDPELAAQKPDGMVEHSIRSPETTALVKLIKRLDPHRRLTHPWLEPRKREWTYPALRWLEGQDFSRFDVLLTCSQPHANHLLGLELQKRVHIPWVAYFSDPWTDSPYAHYGSEKVLQYNRKLEDEILSHADCVLYTCEEMRRLVLEHHPVLAENRTGVLPHAFVPEWYERESSVEDSDRGAGLQLLHTGNFYGPRTPEPLIESIRRVSERLGHQADLQIDLYGGMAKEHQQTIRSAGLAETLRLHGMIPYLETLRRMRQSDGLLLVDAPLSSTAESVFLPSKLVDYLGSGTPILAVTPEHGATARVVRETGGIVCAIEKPKQLDRALEQSLLQGRVPAKPRADAVTDYDYRNVGANLVRIFESLIEDT